MPEDRAEPDLAAFEAAEVSDAGGWGSERSLSVTKRERITWLHYDGFLRSSVRYALCNRNVFSFHGQLFTYQKPSTVNIIDRV